MSAALGLPTELILKVLSHSEITSVGTFLQAFPELAERTVLVTDSGSAIELFGNVKGVARATASLSNVDSPLDSMLIIERTADDVNDLEGTSLIQLIEITNPDMFSHWADIIQSQRAKTLLRGECGARRWLPDFQSETTFVFLRQPMLTRSYVDERVGIPSHPSDLPFFNLRRELADSRKLTWHVGQPVYPSFQNGPSTFLTGTGLAVLAGSTRYLGSLRVDGCLEMSGYEFPFLKHLVVDFAPMQRAPGAGRPSITHVSIPSILTMVVYYHKTPPFFGNIQANPTGGYAYDMPETTFELTDVRVMCGQGGVHEMLQEPAIETDGMDMSFTKDFKCLSFNGVPRVVLDMCNFEKSTVICLSIAHESHYPSPETWLGMPFGLRRISLMSAMDGWTLPELQLKEGSFLMKLELISLGHSLNLHQWLTEQFLVFDRCPCSCRYRFMDQFLVHMADKHIIGDVFPQDKHKLLFERELAYFQYTEVTHHSGDIETNNINQSLTKDQVRSSHNLGFNRVGWKHVNPIEDIYDLGDLGRVNNAHEDTPVRRLDGEEDEDDDDETYDENYIPDDEDDEDDDEDDISTDEDFDEDMEHLIDPRIN